MCALAEPGVCYNNRNTLETRQLNLRMEVFARIWTTGTNPTFTSTLHQGNCYEPVGIILYSKVAPTELIK
jgi:hypothetical protein